METSVYKILEKNKNKFSNNNEEELYFSKYKYLLKQDSNFNKYLENVTPFTLIQANIIIRGLKNKEDMDNLIIEGFNNKISNLNDILKERCLDYPYIKYDDYRVYFPFFNRITNEVYSNEVNRLKDSPYNDLFLNYKPFIVDPFDTYGVDLYDSTFTKLVRVDEDLTSVAFYSYHMNAIFIINKQGTLDNVIYLFDKYLKNINKSHVIDRVKEVVKCYYSNNLHLFITTLYKNEFISYKVYKRLCKAKKI